MLTNANNGSFSLPSFIKPSSQAKPRKLKTRSSSKMNRTYIVINTKANPESIDAKDLLITNTELKRRNEELHSELIFFKEKAKSDLSWKESFTSELNDYNKKLKHQQSYILSLESKLRDCTKSLTSLKSKLQLTESKLAEAKSYLIKAKEIIENNEITIETYRSMKLGLQETIKYLYSQDKLTNLSFKYIELRDNYMPVISNILKASPSVENLDLEGNLITDDGVPHICEIISTCSSRLHTINLEYNQITTAGTWKLLQAMSLKESSLRPFPNNGITQIKLSQNRFDSQNSIYVKVWELFEEKGVDIRGIIDKKHLLSATPAIIAKTFSHISEKYENPDIKAIVSALSKFNIQYNVPTDHYQQDFHIKPDENIMKYFEEYANPVKEANNLNEELIELSVEPLAHADIDIQSVFSQGFNNYSRIVDRLIDCGVNINTIDSRLQENMLIYAARNKIITLIQYLIKKGADIEIMNNKHENAFLVACKSGNFEIAEYLLSKGAKITSADKKKRSAMHLSVLQGNLLHVKRLMKMGVSVNLADIKYRTPLHYACKLGFEEIVNVLIEAGSEVSVKDVHGMSPLELGLKFGHESLKDIFFIHLSD